MPRPSGLLNRINRLAGRWRTPPDLPDSVKQELVATMFGMAAPIVMLGLLLGAIGSVLAWYWHDGMLAVLTGAMGVVTIARIAVIARFRRTMSANLHGVLLARWERRYAQGACIFALMLGLFTARVVQYREPMADMVALSMVFTFGAGTVLRTASRLAICIASLLLVTVPTASALGIAAASQQGDALGMHLLAAESAIIALVALMAIGSARNHHSATLDRLIDRHDLRERVRKDDLTGLANRMHLRERLMENRQLHDGRACRIALLFLDLDGFKTINDKHGHMTGDAVLCSVATRLQSLVRSGDLVARIGGDEFVVMQYGIHCADEAGALARRILASLRQAYTVRGIELRLSVSIGIATGAQQPDDWESLLACADAALYMAKSAGKGRIAIFAKETCNARIWTSFDCPDHCMTG